MHFLADSSDSSDSSSTTSTESSDDSRMFNGLYLPDNNSGEPREITFQLVDLNDILQCTVTDARTVPHKKCSCEKEGDDEEGDEEEEEEEEAVWILFFDDLGKDKGLPLNSLASSLFKQEIYGPGVLVDEDDDISIADIA